VLIRNLVGKGTCAVGYPDATVLVPILASRGTLEVSGGHRFDTVFDTQLLS
jgi:hypothetical protein